MSNVEKAKHELAKLPKAIQGQKGGPATFKAAVILIKKHRLTEEQAWPILQAWNESHCVPVWREGELRRKLRDAAGGSPDKQVLLEGGTGGRASPFDPALLERVAALSPGVDEGFIKSRSPLTVAGPEDFLRVLYKRGQHVVCFGGTNKSQGTLWTHQGPLQRTELEKWMLKDWQNGAWYMIHPVTGKFLVKPDGTRTRRSTENVTEHRYLLIESDHCKPELWLRAIASLPLKIVSLVKSGGKSIHALVNLETQTLPEWRSVFGQMKSFLTSLGADPHAFSSAQLSRLPFITRAGVLQELIYLSPDADGTPINSQPLQPNG